MNVICSGDSSLGTSPPEGWMGYLNTMVSSSAAYLPTQLSETLSQSRSHAIIRMSVSNIKKTCALTV